MVFETFELISLASTFPGVFLAVIVLYHFLVPAWLKLWRVKESRDWLRVGIAAGFFGSVIDNGFWFVAWSINFLSISGWDIFPWGVFFNIPFRQAALILAAYAHIRAVLVVEDTSQDRIKDLNKYTIYFSLIGVAYAIGLFSWKYLL